MSEDAEDDEGRPLDETHDLRGVPEEEGEVEGVEEDRVQLRDECEADVGDEELLGEADRGNAERDGVARQVLALPGDDAVLVGIH